MSDVSTTSSGMTGAGGGSLLRITGMSTGLDVDAIVKKMMLAEQTKLDKAQQDQQAITWKQEAYQDIISDIKGLQSSFFDTGSSSKNILSSTNFSPFTVSGVGTDTVDTSVATFTPGVGVQTGTYEITVNSLAEGAKVSNTVYSPNNQTTTKATLSTKLTDINSSLSGSISLKLSVNGSSTPINITLNNSGTSTLQDLVNAVNNQGGGSVKASFSELTGEFKLNTVATGKTATLTIGSESTDALSSILGTYTEGTAIDGSNANITITPPGGEPVTLNDKTSNSFTIDGMSYKLSSKGTTKVSVGSDTDKVYDKVKDFIDKYNTIVDKIQTKLTEKKNYDYKPLTDSQKEDMSDSQITAWETKAKTGILRNDNTLQNMLNSLRSAFTTGVSGNGLAFGKYSDNSIGIDMSSDTSTPGHVEIADASKLKEAISSNADQILKMFTNISTSTDSSTYNGNNKKYKEDGIFTRIKSILESNVGYTNTTLNTALLTSYANKQYDYSLTGTAGKGTLPDQLHLKKILIDKIKDAMETKQERYYKQFSQLETAMTTLSAQQATLSSLMG